MSEVINTTIKVEVTVTLKLNETEVRALDGIFGYQVEQFLKVFYEKMGKAYVQPYEAGVRSLHKNIRAQMAGPIAAADAARRKLSQP